LTEAASGEPTLREILRFGVLNSIFKINVGVDVVNSGRGRGIIRAVTFVSLGRKGGRDGVGRSRKAGGLLLGWKRSCCHSSEAILSSPEICFTRLWDVDRLRHSSEG